MIDELATKKNVKAFFKNEFELLVLSAGFGLTSGKHPLLKTNLNDYDRIADDFKRKKTVERVRILKRVVSAMNNTNERSKAILFGSYVERKRNDDLFNKIGVKKSQYYNLKGKALLEFADNIRNLIDLHVYQ